MERLAAAGFITQRTSGRNRYVRVDPTHSIFSAVAEILRYSYGPLALLPGIISRLRGVERAFVYGSWAARHEGESGADPNDIDVLVIGDLDRNAVYEAASEASRELNREANFRLITTEAWEQSNDLFVKTVRARLLIEMPLHRERLVAVR